MIILPERNAPRGLILPPMLRTEWCAPSLAQPKDQFGNENRTRFSITARLHDGHIAWRGWFDDREDADAFFLSAIMGALDFERSLWDFPVPAWRPDIGHGADLAYEFVTTVFLTGGASWIVPGDCIGLSNKPGEFVDCIGAGGSGGASWSSSLNVSGGGGGAFSRITSIALTPAQVVQIQVGAGGGFVSRSGVAGGTVGNAGADTWFAGASLAGSAVGAQGGRGGTTGGAVTNGALGGDTSGPGALKFAGGRAGNKTNGGGGVRCAQGAGGAAGFAGAGGNGVDHGSTFSGNGSNGGTGNAGSGGAGAAGITANGTANRVGNNGGNGGEWGSGVGAGGGAGGLSNSAGTGTITAGSGGFYGGGGGAVASTSNPTTVNSGSGAQGIIIVAYEPSILRQAQNYYRRMRTN
ncbi:MAG: hypothetical protein GEU95_01245 [Rhizobiales bacterium]|nr:hypothetical protein [Hyphomicrobiales bacterium]